MSAKAKSKALDLSQLTEEEKDRLATLEHTVETSVTSVGKALFEIRDSRLYREKFKTFDDYLLNRWGFSKAHGNRLIAAAKVVENLAPIGVIADSESVLRPLTVLEPEEQREAYQEAVKASPSGKPTAKLVKAEAQKRKPARKALRNKPEPESARNSVEVPLEPVPSIQPKNQTRGDFVDLHFEMWVDHMEATFPQHQGWLNRQALIDIISGEYPQTNEVI
jgi:hypothetical protein